MGLISFIKNAGKKLGIGDEELPTAQALKKELDSYNLGTENVSVELDGDKAIVKGAVADQSALEKTLLAVGNTLGISQVDSQLKAPDQKDPVLYTVTKGDSLWKIAESQYGKEKGRSTPSFSRPTSRCSRIPTRSIRVRCFGYRPWRRLDRVGVGMTSVVPDFVEKED